MLMTTTTTKMMMKALSMTAMITTHSIVNVHLFAGKNSQVDVVPLLLYNAVVGSNDRLCRCRPLVAFWGFLPCYDAILIDGHLVEDFSSKRKRNGESKYTNYQRSLHWYKKGSHQYICLYSYITNGPYNYFSTICFLTIFVNLTSLW